MSYHPHRSRTVHILTFLTLGVFAFVGYYFEWGQVFLYLESAPIYLSYLTKENILPEAFVSQTSPVMLHFFIILLPHTLIYYAFLGFLFHHLNHERGAMRVFSIGVFFGFIIIMHFLAWKSLIGYLAPLT